MLATFGPGESAPDELPPVRIPQFVREDLGNGMTILVAQHREQPVVFYHLLVRAGRLHDPRGKEGLCDILADMLQEGTKRFDSLALAQALDSLGGEFSVEPRPESVWLSAQVLSRQAEKALELLAEVALRPTFPESALRRVKQQHRSTLRASHSDPGFVGNRHFYALVYGEELPFGRFATEATIKRIRRDDLQAFYDRHFSASNAVLAAIGDFEPAGMLERLKRQFSEWRAGEPTPRVALPESFRYRPGRRLVIKKKLTQATIILGGRGAPVISDRYEAFGLANHILGASGFSSRLMEAVRSEKGKTYGIHSSNVAAALSGTFMVQTFTRNDNVGETTGLVFDILRAAMDKGLNAEELGKAKTAKIGEFPLRFEYPGNWARSAISDLFYGRDLGYTPKSRERIARIDLPQVNEAMRRTLDPETMALVIVGDPAQLQGQLSGLEEFEVRKEKDDWY